MTQVSPQWKKRRRFFEIYSENLSAVKKHPRVHIEPDESDVFVCPLCFEYFTRQEVLTEDSENSAASIEHVPPKALGGKERTLTCKWCNTESGHALDSHLIHKLALDDFLEGVPGSSVDAQVELNDEIKLNASLELKEARRLHIRYDRKRSDPKEAAKLSKLERLPTISVSFRGSRGKVYEQRRPECALLRIAYLWAFSEFGYGFVMSDSLKYIRGQIKFPEKEILPVWGIARRNDFPDKCLGVNIITEPKELQSFLIVFDVYSSLRKYRYGVVLPGPTNPGPKIYEWLQGPSSTTDYKISLIHIPSNPAHLNNPDLSFISHEIWKHWRPAS